MASIPRALPEACIRALDADLKPDDPTGLRDAAIICLLATYGVRGVQIRRLGLHHIDWEHDRIQFPTAKGGTPIAQYLTPKAGNRLSEYILQGRPHSSQANVFLTSNPPFRPPHSALVFVHHHLPADHPTGHTLATRSLLWHPRLPTRFRLPHDRTRPCSAELTSKPSKTSSTCSDTKIHRRPSSMVRSITPL